MLCYIVDDAENANNSTQSTSASEITPTSYTSLSTIHSESSPISAVPATIGTSASTSHFTTDCTTSTANVYTHSLTTQSFDSLALYSSADISDISENSEKEWFCTPEELSALTTEHNTSLNTKTSKRNSSTPQSYTPQQPLYIFVKTDSEPSTSRPKTTKISSKDPVVQHSQLDTLQVRLDVLVEKVHHGIDCATKFIQHNDTDSAIIQELRSLRDTVTHSKISIHQSCAKLRQPKN